MEVLRQNLVAMRRCRSDEELLAPVHPVHPSLRPSVQPPLFSCSLCPRGRDAPASPSRASRQPFPTLPNPGLLMPPPKCWEQLLKYPRAGEAGPWPLTSCRCRGRWVWHGDSMRPGCPQVPCLVCHPSSRAGWVEFCICKGVLVCRGRILHAPHPPASRARCAVLAGSHGGVPLLFGGEDPPRLSCASLPPYRLNLLSRGLGAVAICEPANNGINSFPWPGPNLTVFLAPPSRYAPPSRGTPPPHPGEPAC